jgi:hypothetical protein
MNVGHRIARLVLEVVDDLEAPSALVSKEHRGVFESHNNFVACAPMAR